VRRLAYEAADSGLLSPELAPGIRRVKGVKQLGSRLGNWLTSDQAKLLLEKADGEDLRSLRDLAMIHVLLGCGLRRAELSSLEVEDMQIRQGHWAIVDLVGKGGHGEKAFPRTSFGTWFGDVPNGRAWTTSLHTICAAMPNAGLCRIACVSAGKRCFCDLRCCII
jgi:integrase